MVRKVKWLTRADLKFAEILSYLLDEWGQATSKEFYEKTMHTIDLLMLFPEMGIVENKDKRIHSFLIVSQIRVFYRFDQNTLFILNFFDTRQHNKKRQKIIRDN